MSINFEKYQGTGNDFILIDDRDAIFSAGDKDLISRMCNRHFGIGSDGLILVRKHEEVDFTMVFFNPDGSQSLCGNGSRCAVHFAKAKGMAKAEGKFLTTDGVHAYKILDDSTIGIHMRNVSESRQMLGHRFIHTGSPHLVVYCDDVDSENVVDRGRALRYDAVFEAMIGANINFVSPMGDGSFGVRTYERGVENETLSCGTGVTAVALALALDAKAQGRVEIHTHGGVLLVRFSQKGNNFENIWLEGPVKHVFTGTFNA